jgi:hypothetical protein
MFIILVSLLLHVISVCLVWSVFLSVHFYIKPAQNIDIFKVSAILCFIPITNLVVLICLLFIIIENIITKHSLHPFKAINNHLDKLYSLGKKND